MQQDIATGRSDEALTSDILLIGDGSMNQLMQSNDKLITVQSSPSDR